MNKSGLAQKLAEKIKIDPKTAEKMINSFGGAITDTLAKGEKVVYSNFGTFYTVHYPSKIIYHPLLGAKKKMVMAPTNAVKWMPSGNIKEMVNTGKDIESATTFGSTKKLRESSKVNSDIDDEIVLTPKTGGNAETKAAAPPADPIADQSINGFDKPLKEEEEIEIPIRRIIKENAPVDDAPAQETEVEKQKEEKPLESTDKSGFWDHLFSKAKDEVPPVERKNEAETLPENNEKDEKTGHSVGTGIFSNQSNIGKIDEGEAKKEPEGENKENQEKKEEEITDQPPTGVEDDLPPFITRKTTISYVDLSKTTIAKEIIQKIPEKIAREYRIVPIEENEKELIVAMIDPEDIEAIEIVKKMVGKAVSPRLTTETDLNHVLDQYQGFESEMKEAIDDLPQDKDKEGKAGKEEGQKEFSISSSDNAPASRIVSSLLKRAIRDKASDIHIEPFDDEVVVRFRIDGVLHKKVSLPKAIQQAVVSRIKILSNLKIDEQRLPQDGRFSIQNDNRRVDFRVSTMPIANGEKVVMRILDKLSGIISIDDLGFRKRDLELVNLYCQKSHGMILVTGPTGSGKTTTLYALIDKIYSEGINIITLEDPIEYQIQGINQSQVNAEIEYTFASGLRSILRQDPDVVMIGEIRDKETAEMAVHAALTGHVVLSTLHTNDSAGALPRLIDMKIEPFLLNSSLNLVIGQRLARKICDSCKEEVTPSSDQLKVIKEEIEKLPKSEKTALGKLKFFKGKGCKECSDTGFKGRIGLYEILEVSEKIKGFVAKESSSDEIKDTAISEGMTTMIQDGILKAMTGSTTLEEVWRVTKE